MMDISQLVGWLLAKPVCGLQDAGAEALDLVTALVELLRVLGQLYSSQQAQMRKTPGVKLSDKPPEILFQPRRLA
jgi:hypothetical protein